MKFFSKQFQMVIDELPLAYSLLSSMLISVATLTIRGLYVGYPPDRFV